jgi:hypothetical protein
MHHTSTRSMQAAKLLVYPCVHSKICAVTCAAAQCRQPPHLPECPQEGDGLYGLAQAHLVSKDHVVANLRQQGQQTQQPNKTTSSAALHCGNTCSRAPMV